MSHFTPQLEIGEFAFFHSAFCVPHIFLAHSFTVSSSLPIELYKFLRSLLHEN